MITRLERERRGLFTRSTRGATVTFITSFTNDFQILAGYVFSKTIDDTSFGSEQFQNLFVSRTRGLDV
jgi:hypothetical protein